MIPRWKQLADVPSFSYPNNLSVVKIKSFTGFLSPCLCTSDGWRWGKVAEENLSLEGIVYYCHEPVACLIYLCTHLDVCVCSLAAACSNP